MRRRFSICKGYVGMETVFIPSEADFRRWVKEAVMECLKELGSLEVKVAKSTTEDFLNRKQVAAMFEISLVTLHDWMKKGLPSHKQGGRVYFISEEVISYVKRNRRPVLNPKPNK